MVTESHLCGIQRHWYLIVSPAHIEISSCWYFRDITCHC